MEEGLSNLASYFTPFFRCCAQPQGSQLTPHQSRILDGLGLGIPLGQYRKSITYCLINLLLFNSFPWLAFFFSDNNGSGGMPWLPLIRFAFCTAGSSCLRLLHTPCYRGGSLESQKDSHQSSVCLMWLSACLSDGNSRLLSMHGRAQLVQSDESVGSGGIKCVKTKLDGPTAASLSARSTVCTL
jgi:hypothetical protein